MKIKFNQDYNYSFDGINPISFKKGHIYENYKDDFCNLMIERGYAVDAEPKEIVIENKRADIEDKKVFTKPETDTGLVTKENANPEKARVERPPKKGKRKK